MFKKPENMKEEPNFGQWISQLGNIRFGNQFEMATHSNNTEFDKQP